MLLQSSKFIGAGLATIGLAGAGLPRGFGVRHMHPSPQPQDPNEDFVRKMVELIYTVLSHSSHMSAMDVTVVLFPLLFYKVFAGLAAGKVFIYFFVKRLLIFIYQNRSYINTVTVPDNYFASIHIESELLFSNQDLILYIFKKIVKLLKIQENGAQRHGGLFEFEIEKMIISSTNFLLNLNENNFGSNSVLVRIIGCFQINYLIKNISVIMHLIILSLHLLLIWDEFFTNELPNLSDQVDRRLMISAINNIKVYLALNQNSNLQDIIRFIQREENLFSLDGSGDE